MVSGFFTSPKDHERIRSGEANAILIASKSSVWRCWLKRLSRSFIGYLRVGGISYRGRGGKAFCGTRDSGLGTRKAGALALLAFPSPGSRVPRPGSLVFQFHVDGQRADFLH